MSERSSQNGADWLRFGGIAMWIAGVVILIGIPQATGGAVFFMIMGSALLLLGRTSAPIEREIMERTESGDRMGYGLLLMIVLIVFGVLFMAGVGAQALALSRQIGG